jgi:DNA repair exonuclease SbcCD nuclease subunit
MSVEALIIGDPHYKTKNEVDTRAFEKAILDLLSERKPDFIVVLGDILDTHERIHESPLSRAVFFLHKLRKIAPLYVIIGNHDRISNVSFLTDEHPFNALKYWDNTMVVDVVKQDKIKDHLFTFVPYVTPGRFREAIDTLYGKLKGDQQPSTRTVLSEDIDLSEDNSLGDWRESTCIFAHQEFKGAKMGAITSEEGDEWDLSNPLVVSGHIHDYDHLQPNIIYTGTPLQHAFGDRSDKTVSWFTFGPKPSEYKEERIDLNLPKKVIVKVKFDDIDETELPANSQVKLVIVGNTSQIKTASKLKKIKEWIKAGVKVSYRDISEINFTTDKTLKTFTFPELLVETLKEEDGATELIKLFKEISA